jgi:hypothetical protein
MWAASDDIEAGVYSETEKNITFRAHNVVPEDNLR